VFPQSGPLLLLYKTSHPCTVSCRWSYLEHVTKGAIIENSNARWLGKITAPPDQLLAARGEEEAFQASDDIDLAIVVTIWLDIKVMAP